MQVYAGVLADPKLYLSPAAQKIYASGTLIKDLRKEGGDGVARDFSKRLIQTSQVMKCVRTDRGVDIYTKNSIYHTSDDIIEGLPDEVTWEEIKTHMEKEYADSE